MTRGGIYDKKTGEEYQWPSQLIDKEIDSEQIAYAFGELLNILFDRNLITQADVIDIVPSGSRWYTDQKPKRPDAALSESP